MNQYISLAVIVTCHNRKNVTIKCLEKISSQQIYRDVDVVLVDDGSTDGTSEEIIRTFPNVRIIAGNGKLYWNGGMRKAFQAARDHGYDYYLWLNDDTILFEDALMRLLANSENYKSSIVVGSVLDPTTKEHAYGGLCQTSKLQPLKFTVVKPDEKNNNECDTFNGNCVLIPKIVVEQVGNLSEKFTHGMGDFDYGLRAKRLGIKSIVAPGYYGYCSKNSLPVCFDKSNNLFCRIRSLHTPKGLPPLEWMIFARRHAPYLWPFYIMKLYKRVIFP